MGGHSDLTGIDQGTGHALIGIDDDSPRVCDGRRASHVAQQLTDIAQPQRIYLRQSNARPFVGPAP